MGIGEELAKQAQEKAKLEKGKSLYFGNSEEQSEYFKNEPDEAIKELTENNRNNPLHWTQYEANKPKTEEQQIKEFAQHNYPKTLDEFFK